MSKEKLAQYLYKWPYFNPSEESSWEKQENSQFVRFLPEKKEELEKDSRWPGFFPAPICFVTASDGDITALEKVVGASIVNRFPYIIALSFCIESLSKRHYVRSRFMETLEKGEAVAVQYFEPGDDIDKVMKSIIEISDDNIDQRIEFTGLKTIKAKTNNSPVFSSTYMVYEARLVKPGKDFGGEQIFDKPYTDHGSHRIYYLEIEAIQLREDISKGDSQIHWQALPSWEPISKLQNKVASKNNLLKDVKYQKGFSANYLFPSKNTIGFEYDTLENGMAIKVLPKLAKDQVQVDNDKARWPCFFPSSVGMITTWDKSGAPNLMPCGSTTILVRHPLCIGVCVSYAEINDRYAPRGSTQALNETKKFGCGVPFINDTIIDAIKYAGNVSINSDIDKLVNAGLEVENNQWSPVLPALPIHFDCEVVKIVRLGTHFLYIGEVKAIRVREDVTENNPLNWYPYPDVLVNN